MRFFVLNNTHESIYDTGILETHYAKYDLREPKITISLNYLRMNNLDGTDIYVCHNNPVNNNIDSEYMKIHNGILQIYGSGYCTVNDIEEYNLISSKFDYMGISIIPEITKNNFEHHINTINRRLDRNKWNSYVVMYDKIDPTIINYLNKIIRNIKFIEISNIPHKNNNGISMYLDVSRLLVPFILQKKFII